MKIKRAVLSALLILGLVNSPSSAWLIQKPSGAYTGPGDIASFTAWYGLRAYSTAQLAGTTKSILIDRTSDSQACDVLINTSGSLGNTTSCTGAANGTPFATFCSATSCRVQKWYDQTQGNHCGGSSCDLVAVNTGVSRPQLLSGTGSTGFPNNSYPAFSEAGNTQILRTATNFTPSAALLSFVGVGRRATGTGLVYLINDVGSGNGLRMNNVANQWILVGGSSGSITIAATDATWHEASGVLNGASSVVNVDGTDATGTATASTTGAKPLIQIAAGTTVNRVEGGWIDNVGLTSAQRTSLSSNARTYWGY